MNFDVSKFMGSLGNSLMQMNGGGGGGGMGQAPMQQVDLSQLFQMFQRPRANDLAQRYDNHLGGVAPTRDAAPFPGGFAAIGGTQFGRY